MGLALLGLFGFKTEFEINGIKQEVSNFADLESINAISQQTSEALDGLWFTYNIVPIIGLIIALIIWKFYKLNDKDVQVMADCNVGKISKEDADKLLSKKY
jgi:Na+/melibiose symporter-like transporter